MKFTAEIDVMPQKALLDPQGKAVHHGLNSMGFGRVNDVRIGKHITLTFDATDQAEAESIVEKACKELLANPIMESFSYSITEA